MKESLVRLVDHLEHRQGYSKVIVWAHNSHLGDARATERSKRGEHNLGQLARQHYGDQCYNIGFSTYTGTVTAASDWDGDAERKYVRPGLPGSYERLFHKLGFPRFVLDSHKEDLEAWRQSYLQRAIGVIYRPETER